MTKTPEQIIDMSSLKQMHERFDERLKKRVEKGGFTYLYENRDELDPEAIKSFTESEIQLARKEAQEEYRQFILNILDGHDQANKEHGFILLKPLFCTRYE